jgi:hypothetical protein
MGLCLAVQLVDDSTTGLILVGRKAKREAMEKPARKARRLPHEFVRQPSCGVTLF